MDRVKQLDSIQERASDLYHSQQATAREWLELGGSVESYVKAMMYLAEIDDLDEHDGELFRGVLVDLAEGDLGLVVEGAECPQCGERRMDYLTWISDEQGEWVVCATCGKEYSP